MHDRRYNFTSRDKDEVDIARRTLSSILPMVGGIKYWIVLSYSTCEHDAKQNSQYHFLPEEMHD